MSRTTTGTDDSLEVAVEEREAWKRRLTITVDASRVAKARAKERDKLSKKLRLKGFRAGKVPTAMVEKQYGGLVDQRTVQQLVEEAYREAVKRQSLEPIGRPEFGQVHYAQGENLTFQVDVEIMPTLRLQRLGGFRISRPEVSVSDEEVESVLQRLREERGVWEPYPGRPEEGDLVAVRISGAKDEAAAGAKDATGAAAAVGGSVTARGAGRAGVSGRADKSVGELYRFPLGGGYAIEDVEEAVGTLSPGESDTFTVEFPEDFGDSAMAGRTRRLQIELVEAKRRRLSKLDDAFATEVGDFTSLADLREKVQADLLRHSEEEAEQRVRDEILDSIIEANPFDVPESLVDVYLERLLGGDAESDDPRDREARSEARRSVRPIAEQQLKREMVLEHLIDELGLEASDAQLDAHIASVAERRQLDARELRRQWARKGGLDSAKRKIVIDAAFEHLKGLSTIE